MCEHESAMQSEGYKKNCLNQRIGIMYKAG